MTYIKKLGASIDAMTCAYMPSAKARAIIADILRRRARFIDAGIIIKPTAGTKHIAGQYRAMAKWIDPAKVTT